MLVGRRLPAAVGTLASILGVAACGSGTTGTAPRANASANAERRRDGERWGSRCRHASEPAPRGTQHVPRPTGGLNPAKHYVVTLATNCGAISIQLDVKRAPKTTASFAYLVRRGFYNDLTFHRVAANFVIQGGDPNGDGSGGPGYTVVEPPPASLHYTRGTVAMAKTATDPAGASGSQFFIVTAQQTDCHRSTRWWKRRREYDGVDAISKLATVPPQDGQPIDPVVISRATLSES